MQLAVVERPEDDGEVSSTRGNIRMGTFIGWIESRITNPAGIDWGDEYNDC
jgi:hypothetical protein